MTSKVKPRKLMKEIKDEVVYYDHQVEFSRKGARLRSFVLADEMGLGKSLQALTISAIAFAMGQAARILVVSPASIKGNWDDEITKFLRGISAMVLDGTPKQREAQLAKFDHQILVINYEQIESHMATLKKLGFEIVIADECHYLKDRDSKRSKAYLELRPYIRRHFLLTGTPLLNQVDDLWMMLHICNPREFPDYWRFVNRYAMWGGYKDKEIVGVKNEKELREKVDRYFIRRTKDECLDLPDKVIVPVKIQMHPDQRKLYKQAKDELMMDNPLDASSPYEINHNFTKLTKLTQIAGSMALIEGYKDISPKLDVAVDKIIEITSSGSPIVVFTRFRKMMELLQFRLENLPHPVPVSVLHGDIKKKDRQPVIQQWTNDSKAGQHGALICMYQVGGVGFNMVEANNLIALDKLWVPGLNSQAYDRLHRIGQTKTVYIWELLMVNTIETRIEQVNKSKTSVFKGVFDAQAPGWRKKVLQAALEEEDEAA